MFARMPLWVRQHLAAFRALLVLTALTIGYTLVVTAVAQIPGLKARADGNLVKFGGRIVGSSLIGQNFLDSQGNPLAQFFQPRPSAAGAAGYDPTASGASNLGPESIIDTLANPAQKGSSATLSLLSQVCERSLAVGAFNGVNGLRPYCTAEGLGAVLSVIRVHGLTGPIRRVVSVNQECPVRPFISSYDGLPVQCAEFGVNYAVGQIVLIRGPGKPWPQNPVPPDAVTASGSGLDPDISLAYALLQVNRVAAARHLPASTVRALVEDHVVGRTLGFMGDPYVDVLELNLALARLPSGG